MVAKRKKSKAGRKKRQASSSRKKIVKKTLKKPVKKTVKKPVKVSPKRRIVHRKATKSPKGRKKRRSRELLPRARNTKRQGPLKMRGADGIERAVHVREFWEKIDTHALLSLVEKTLRGLFASWQHAMKPTVYTRFTLWTSGIEEFRIGSPALDKPGFKRLYKQKRPWFVLSSLSYEMNKAIRYAAETIDEITVIYMKEKSRNPRVKVFLQYFTCRAYKIS